ncbi:MAG TPA: MarR family transcriptional regulator [Candidatus Dormibacteraeota bacterium]|jgi:DNA-binding MarR family transcriptional regulator|nr:MarR family transcriptional regulator [Candidatus Dormibacteraeota bacterium]HEX2680022.1 MarR family transcriptional regulator [Candidatus Dormibacteraeota bacterium]
MSVLKEPPELLESTGYLLARAGSESRRRFVEALSRQELTLAAYSVLMILGGLSGATQRQLAEAAGIDPRNLVPILDDLEARGFVARDSHPGDRRRHAVRLSSAGRAKLARLGQVGAKAEQDLLEPLSAAQRKQLHSLLHILLTGNMSGQ